MFRASSAHIQEDTVVHMQRMVLSLCKQVICLLLQSKNLKIFTCYCNL